MERVGCGARTVVNVYVTFLMVLQKTIIIYAILNLISHFGHSKVILSDVILAMLVVLILKLIISTY